MVLESERSKYKNLIPRDGTVFYLPDFMEENMAQQYYEQLLKEIDWEEKTIKIFGKEIMQPRKIAWYGDEGVKYTYSNLTQVAKPWNSVLLNIKSLVEAQCGASFNSVLLNLYRSDRDSMGWHSDNEKELGLNPLIASVSFGDARIFQLKHNTTADKVSLLLENGSLLIMAGSTQHFWKHQLPKRRALCGPRINLTFRNILSN